MAIAVANLGAADDTHALAAARWIAAEIATAGAKPNAVASGLLGLLEKMATPLPARGFAELGPRATRKRLAELSQRRGIAAEDKARVMTLRERLAEDPRAPISGDEIAWLDARWEDDTRGRAKAAG
jgi:hypothetical protein